MNIYLGNLALEDIVKEQHLEKIKAFLDENGFRRETVCDKVGDQEGNYHIYDMPRQIQICGQKKAGDFVDFLKRENLVADGFKERMSLACI